MRYISVILLCTILSGCAEVAIQAFAPAAEYAIKSYQKSYKSQGESK